MRYTSLPFLAFISSAAWAQTLCTGSIDLGPDVVLCEGQTVLISPGPDFLSYTWNDGSTLPVRNLGTAGVYTCTVEELDLTRNLVVNGDFSDGATGFTSGYIPGTGGSWGLLSLEGQYAVADNASATHSNFPPCTDHTGGGNMMVVNGASIAGVAVWCQTITVEPGTNYAFSAWLATIIVTNPAILQFTINGEVLGAPFEASTSACTWNQFNQVWNSGTNTQAEICITNQNTEVSGNDFALDDIVFSPYCTYTDSVSISVDPYPEPELGPDQVLCGVDSVVLDATTDGVDTYTWNSGLFSGPQLTVSTSGTYWIDVLNGACFGRDSVTITLLPQPAVDLGADITACLGDSVLITTGDPGASHLWQDGSTANSFTALETTLVRVTLSQGACTASDSVLVTFAPCGTVVEMPNVFSPNGDGINDRFEAITLEGVNSLQLSIYNRWGQLVHESQSLRSAWDGRSPAGVPVTDGVYFWVLEYSGTDGPGSLNGTVQVVR